ncbi:putative holin-like toxin [Bombilactobacillus mellifer]|nr:putative holin-like toxin [Bombilactobacillus mellifer]
METWNNLEKGFTVMSVFQALSLMLLSGTFLIALLSYIDKHHK